MEGEAEQQKVQEHEEPDVSNPTPQPSGLDEDDLKTVEKAVKEAQEVIPNLKPGGEVGYLGRSTSGLLRLLLTKDGRLFVVGAGNSAWLQKIAAEIALRLGGFVPY